jgi:RNA polymerase nonessential primary-like sigma factor
MSNYYVSAKKDCFGHYLSEIGKYAILTKQQEFEYGTHIQTMLEYKAVLEGYEDFTEDEKADMCGCTVKELRKAMRMGALCRERMLNHNLRLVVFIARKYNNRGVDIEDLVQEGNIGLVRAVEKFDPTLGYKFSTYASWWVKQSIIRAVANQSRTIRLPVHIYDLLNRIKKVERKLSQQRGRLVGASEIAEELNLRLDKLQVLQHCSKKVWSLDSESYNNEDSPSINDCYVDSEQEEETHFLEDMTYKAMHLLSLLDEQERNIIVLRFGLNHKKPMSYKSIADQLNLSSQYIRNASFRIFRKLKILAEDNDIVFYEHLL